MEQVSERQDLGSEMCLLCGLAYLSMAQRGDLSQGAWMPGTCRCLCVYSSSCTTISPQASKLSRPMWIGANLARQTIFLGPAVPSHCIPAIELVKVHRAITLMVLLSDWVAGPLQ